MILRSLVCVLALSGVVPSTASAQSRRHHSDRRPPVADPTPAPAEAPALAPIEQPAPTPAPEASAPVTSPPPTEETPADEAESSVPSGPYVDGGLWLTAGNGSRPFIRVAGGFPLVNHLSLILPLVYRPDRVDVPGYLSQQHTLLLVPGLRNEWPLYIGKGAFSAYVEGGAGAGIVRARVDGFGGQVTESTWLGVARVGGGVSYVTPFGLMAAVQPLGLAVFFDENDARVRYDFSLLIGYRGR